jgi:NADH-quinone oxidoreductase subunit D
MAEMWVNMGPQHPMTHGLWNLRIKIDGETILDCEPELGYLHRGHEKLAENRTWEGYACVADRLCYAAGMSWSMMVCEAAEDAAGIEIPERAQWIRMIVLELNRMVSHLMWLGAYAADLGNMTMFLYPMRERELFMDLLGKLTGQRMTFNYARLGGVFRDVFDEFEHDCERVFKWHEKKLKEYEDMLDNNKVFLMRTVDVGILKPTVAVNAGVTGPTLRGSDVDYDVRKDEPYYFYDDIDWNVITNDGLDCYARHRVRLEEMQESINIMRQCFKALRRLKGQDFMSRDVPLNLPAGAGTVKREDPRGEGMMYGVTNGTDRPYRLRFRSPAFVNISALPYFTIGYKVADIPAIVGSIDVCIGEVDK